MAAMAFVDLVPGECVQTLYMHYIPSLYVVLYTYQAYIWVWSNTLYTARQVLYAYLITYLA